eukprot:7240422-Prymnesium_polylepis.1
MSIRYGGVPMFPRPIRTRGAHGATVYTRGPHDRPRARVVLGGSGHGFNPQLNPCRISLVGVGLGVACTIPGPLDRLSQHGATRK